MPFQRHATVPEHFPHVQSVKKSLLKLHKTLSRMELQNFARSLPTDILRAPGNETPLAHVQRIARRIAQFYLITPRTIAVKFSETLPPIGRIEIDGSNDFFVEIQRAYERDFRTTAAILAHEVTHIFLHVRGITFGETDADEILTDTTATYLGAGWTSLHAFRKGWGVGYLTPQEFGYVLARRDRFFGDNSTKFLPAVKAREAYKAGRTHFRQELDRPPLLTCSLVNRLLYRWRAWRLNDATVDFPSYSWECGTPVQIVFDCPTCTQRLRLPVGKWRLNATCATCGTSFGCRT